MPINMKTARFLFALALVFLFLVLADLFLWFAIASDKVQFEVSRERYLGYYPETIRNARLLTVISILLLTFSGFIFLNASKTNSLKKAAAVLGILSAVLLIWKIFSLM
jgi:hypothetical protein